MTKSEVNQQSQAVSLENMAVSSDRAGEPLRAWVKPEFEQFSLNNAKTSLPDQGERNDAQLSYS